MTTYTASPYDEIKRLNKEVAKFKQMWMDAFNKGIKQGVEINLLQMRLDTSNPTAADAFALQCALDNVTYYKDHYYAVQNAFSAFLGALVRVLETPVEKPKTQYQQAWAKVKELNLKPSNKRKETLYDLLINNGYRWDGSRWNHG